MSGFEVRVGPTTTRFGVCIVGRLCSCLEVVAYVGMDVRRIGSGVWAKRRLFDRIGRVLVVQRPRDTA